MAKPKINNGFKKGQPKPKNSYSYPKGHRNSKEVEEKRSRSLKLAYATGRRKPIIYWQGKKLSSEHKEKLRLKKLDKKFSEEHKKKLSEYWKDKPSNSKGKHWKIKDKSKMFGHIISEETRKKIGEWHINNPNRKYKDTSIELKVEAELIKRDINYQKQVPLCKIAIVDFYLPEYRIVIQADGDYWHNRIGAKERDERQDKVLTFNGFNVYRFWGSEINKNVGECIDKIKWQQN